MISQITNIQDTRQTTMVKEYIFSSVLKSVFMKYPISLYSILMFSADHQISVKSLPSNNRNTKGDEGKSIFLLVGQTPMLWIRLASGIE